MKHDVRLLPSSVDGQSEATWIVADYLDVVLHVFTPESLLLPARRVVGRCASRRGRGRLAGGAESNQRGAGRAAQLLDVRLARSGP